MDYFEKERKESDSLGQVKRYVKWFIWKGKALEAFNAYVTCDPSISAKSISQILSKDLKGSSIRDKTV